MKSKAQSREQKRRARHIRIRKKMSGTSERPRLCVHRSLKQFYAQVIDDRARRVIMGCSTLDRAVSEEIPGSRGTVAAASVLGHILARRAVEKGIRRVCFDRGGYRYHGRVKAFAEAAREGGLEF